MNLTVRPITEANGIKIPPHCKGATHVVWREGASHPIIAWCHSESDAICYASGFAEGWNRAAEYVGRASYRVSPT